jgi:hypothetical protein
MESSNANPAGVDPAGRTEPAGVQERLKGCLLFHGATDIDHPNAVPQQGTVGRVVDVGLHHRRVHAHPAGSSMGCCPLLAPEPSA